MRRPTGHKLIYNFSHYNWTDTKHPDGYHIPVPKNWDFINDIYGEDQWFTGDLMLWGILGFALAGRTQIATDLINQFYTLRTPDSSGRLLFYDRYTADGLHLEGDESKSIAFTALYVTVRNALLDNAHYDEALDALDFYQINSTFLSVDGSYSWDTTNPTAVVENKTLGEVLFAVTAVADSMKSGDASISPLVSVIQKAPSRLARPDDFVNESVIFLDALPTFRTQINELSSHINSVILNKWNYGRVAVQPTFPSISQYQGDVVPTETATVDYIASIDSLYQKVATYSGNVNTAGTYVDMLSNYIGVMAYDLDKPMVSGITSPHTRVMHRELFNYRAELFTESFIDNVNSLYQSMWYNYVITFVGDDYGSLTDNNITHSDDYGLITDTNISY